MEPPVEERTAPTGDPEGVRTAGPPSLGSPGEPRFRALMGSPRAPSSSSIESHSKFHPI